MGTDIKWDKLRTLNGSQHNAFEELCCQLAAYEQAPSGSTFVRVGAPDAGVECYWLLPNSDEWGWQAKFFTSPPRDAQWSQIDESVKDALERHPRLTRYIVCLPIDRQDPRKESRRSLMDRWNERVQRWQSWAGDRGMSVEFLYWGQHELLERLSREEHRGRVLFWLGSHEFSDTWFADRLQEAIDDAGPRYTPELNVELPISGLFDALGCAPAFFDRLKRRADAVRKATPRYDSDVLGQDYRTLRALVDQLWQQAKAAEQLTHPVDWHGMAGTIVAGISEVEACIQRLQRDDTNATAHPGDEHTRKQRRDREDQIARLYNLRTAFRTLLKQVESDEYRLVNVAALLLVGEAGTGKTHLLCDMAKRRVNEGLPTVILLGEKFRDAEPWRQIVRMLGMSCDREEFLGALSAAAEAHGSKGLIIIDALNEGEGKRFWKRHLAGMLTALSKYPWLSFAVSVRNSYTETVVPEGLVPERLVRAEHFGFTEREYEATKAYFDHYGIELPSIPLLVPEFRNPLFLKIFCRGLQAGGHSRIPSGMRGITTIFDFYLDSVNSRLAQQDRLDYNPRAKLVSRAVRALAERLLERGSSWLPHEEAEIVVAPIRVSEGFERSLFRGLIVEGVLAEDRFIVSDGSGRGFRYEDGVRFAYERLADHIMAHALLDTQLDSSDPAGSFTPSTQLGMLIRDQTTSANNRGLIEALSVLLPERLGTEVGVVAPGCADYKAVRAAFIDSLLWRDPATITDRTLEYARAHALRYRDTFEQFQEVLIIVAANPEHPYNADFMHERLAGRGLAERDSWWSTFLHEQYEAGAASPANRLVDWAWRNGSEPRIGDDTARLAATALAWFLTTPNRFLRDRATKALVSLLTGRIHVLRVVLTRFEDVNDPYVLERIYAVAYGCAMRNGEQEDLRGLAQDVYQQIFNNGEVPTNILLRDHARGVIECALRRGLELEVDIERIRPPYGSNWPEAIPSKEEVEKLREEHGTAYDVNRAFGALYGSVFDFGDFARYVIGTNHRSGFEWSSRRLGEAKTPSAKDRYEQFIASLTDRQREAFALYEAVASRRSRAWLIFELETRLDRQVTDEDLEALLAMSEQRFRSMLRGRKKDDFEQHVLPYVKNPDVDEHWFDMSLIQRWILQKVLDLGWTEELFGGFDSMIEHHNGIGRHEDKPERIGKKYQWIALYEILARVADNFEFRPDPWEDRETAYEGPWQLTYLRNIDPSFLLEDTISNWEWRAARRKSWWSSDKEPDWQEPVGRNEWLRNYEGLPDIMQLLQVKRPGDSSEWLTLHGYYEWWQPREEDEELSGPVGRRLEYVLDAYLVREADLKPMLDWARQQNFNKKNPPQIRDLHEYIYLGELYWSPNYASQYKRFREYDEWTTMDDRMPRAVTIMVEGYSWSKGFDCSIRETVGTRVPSKYLADGLGLVWTGAEDGFHNRSGDLVAFDPSVREVGPSVLLVNKVQLLAFLRRCGFAVLWMIRGEKNDYGRGGWPANFAGRLHISGAFVIKGDGNLHGDTWTSFEFPGAFGS